LETQRRGWGRKRARSGTPRTRRRAEAARRALRRATRRRAHGADPRALCRALLAPPPRCADAGLRTGSARSRRRRRPSMRPRLPSSRTRAAHRGRPFPRAGTHKRGGGARGDDASVCRERVHAPVGRAARQCGRPSLAYPCARVAWLFVREARLCKPPRAEMCARVSSMDVRHILVEKHGDAVKILEQIKSGTPPALHPLNPHPLHSEWACERSETLSAARCPGAIPFNDAARQHSIDKAGKCGLLGWKTQGELDPVCKLAVVYVCNSLLCMHVNVCLSCIFSRWCTRACNVYVSACFHMHAAYAPHTCHIHATYTPRVHACIYTHAYTHTHARTHTHFLIHTLSLIHTHSYSGQQRFSYLRDATRRY